MHQWPLVILIVLGATLIVKLRRISSRRGLPFPPGPRPLPYIGHILQVPTTHTWRYFQKLHREYGSLVRLTLAGDELLVLGSAQDAEELLSKRSSNYSSRKQLIYAGKYQSNNRRLVLLPYGERLRQQRAAFHQMVQPKVVGAYEVMQETEATKLLYEMLTRPEDFTRNCQRYAASLVYYLSYGKRLADDDEDLAMLKGILDNFVRDTYPGAHLVDSIPWLDYLPDFLATWRRRARERHAIESEFYQRLVLEVKQEMDNGHQDMECFAARLWDQKDKLALDLDDIAYVAGTAFEAGTDTTSGSLLWFFMAMVLFPEAMLKAQQELDAVLGKDGDHMPRFSDYQNLPYCTALTKEVFRWAPPAPGGFPHLSDNDDDYKGYKIKANTMVIPCIWSMHHDESQFPDPHVFRPERFLEDATRETQQSLTDGHYSFGFGRRLCPGRGLGSKTVWLAVTRTLWAFNIGPAVDAHGRAIPVNTDSCTSGMTSRPVDFQFSMKVRSANHAKTILGEWNRSK